MPVKKITKTKKKKNKQSLFLQLINRIKNIKSQEILEFILANKILILVVGLYVLLMTSTIRWGLPNNSHPFPYFMDESHQVQAVRTVFKYGTSNYPHQENGPMFHYIISGFLIAPFYVVGLINPFAIKSAIASPDLQQAIYVAFRGTIILFGALSIILVWILAKILKINEKLSILLFSLTPVFLIVSGYFKYDVPFMFWTLLSIVLLLKYSKNQNSLTYLIAGITSAMALSTKITGIPLFVIYIFSFFYFTHDFFKKIWTLVKGILVYALVFIFLGIPDIIFEGRSMSEYLYYNIILNPQNDKTLLFGVSHLEYTFAQLIPTIYGHFLAGIVYVSVIYLVIKVIKYILNKKFNNIKEEAYILLVLAIFSVSLIPLWVIAANRALILLPFLICVCLIFIRDLCNNLIPDFKKLLVVVIVFGMIMQVFETYSWVGLKYIEAPQVTASKWLVQNVPHGETLGIENIPVYEMLPDLVVKEFYEKQYNIQKKYNFNYEIIGPDSKKLPRVIVLSNAEFEDKYRSTSPKKELFENMKKQNYKLVASFSPPLDYHKLFTTDINFVMVGMSGEPLNISVYVKSKKY
ncbi:MAG TPA: phospholipid carrier-dependent glycosyltransferase [Patescibacteria group bacterium]|nr:phospholipid carrier-dependent glycosyltransferase [Patescibacteria group bacterium]